VAITIHSFDICSFDYSQSCAYKRLWTTTTCQQRPLFGSRGLIVLLAHKQNFHNNTTTTRQWGDFFPPPSQTNRHWTNRAFCHRRAGTDLCQAGPWVAYVNVKYSKLHTNNIFHNNTTVILNSLFEFLSFRAVIMITPRIFPIRG